MKTIRIDRIETEDEIYSVELSDSEINVISVALDVFQTILNHEKIGLDFDDDEIEYFIDKLNDLQSDNCFKLEEAEEDEENEDYEDIDPEEINLFFSNLANELDKIREERQEIRTALENLNEAIKRND